VVRAALFAAFVLGQAVILFGAGLATLWWSQDLMGLLIHLVCEERALGAGSVIPQEGGGKLLTNPSAMVRWMLPFWALGAVQITAALSLVALWRRLTSRCSGPGHRARFGGAMAFSMWPVR
jgi:hypothetical protein